MNTAPPAPAPPLPTIPPAASSSASWLDDVPKGEAFDPTRFAQERLSEPKQQYDSAAQAGQDLPPPAGTDLDEDAGLVQPRSATNRKSAAFIISVMNNIQANVFAVVAGNDDPDVFRIKEHDQNDLISYLEEGVATANIKIPWWLPFIAMLGMVLFFNFKKARGIKEQLAAEERARKAAEAKTSVAPGEVAAAQAAQAAKAERQRRSSSPQKAVREVKKATPAEPAKA